MKTTALLVSVLLGICVAAAINLAAPDYMAGLNKFVQASSSSSAWEPLLGFLRLVSTVFKDAAASPLVMHLLSFGRAGLNVVHNVLGLNVSALNIIALRVAQLSLPLHSTRTFAIM